MYVQEFKTNQYLENGLSKFNKLKQDKYLHKNFKYIGLEPMSKDKFHYKI